MRNHTDTNKQYSWAAFYDASCSKLSAENREKLADISTINNRLETTRAHIANLKRSPLYKIMGKNTSAAGAAGKREKAVLRRMHMADSFLKENVTSPFYYDDYEQRREHLNNRYGEWITYQEESCYAKIVEELNSSALESKRTPTYKIIPYSSLTSDYSFDAFAEDYVLLVRDVSCIDPKGEKLLSDYLCAYPDTDVLYGQEDCISEMNRHHLWAKSSWSPNYFLHAFYLGNYVFVRTSLLRNMYIMKAVSYEVNLYDLMLQVTNPLSENHPVIRRLDYVCYHGKEEQPVFFGFQEAFIDCKKKYLERYFSEVSVNYPEGSNIAIVSPVVKTLEKVSIIIPSKDNPEYLKKCIDSVVDGTDYPNMEIIVVDNGSSPEHKTEIEAFLASLSTDHQYIYEKKDFNFSYMCNLGASKANGAFLLFLNDDVEVIEKNWLSRMVTQMEIPGTGVVGAKLWLNENRQIQHAGVNIVPEGPVHKMATMYDADIMYYGQNVLPNEKLCVTGACLLVRKKDYDTLGGMDETFPVAYNDVDFCLKVITAGKRCIVRNDAVLLHHESVSRGHDDMDKIKHDRLMKERKKLYDKFPAYAGKDPYYSELLLGAAFWYEPNYMFPGDTYEEEIMTPMKVPEKSIPLNVGGAGAELYLEHVDLEFAYQEGRGDSYYISGWSKIPGVDQNAFIRKVILQNMQSKESYLMNVWDRERLDAKDVSTREGSNGLLGFTTHIGVKALPQGNYKIGILYYHKEKEKFAVSFSENRQIVVK